MCFSNAQSRDALNAFDLHDARPERRAGMGAWAANALNETVPSASAEDGPHRSAPDCNMRAFHVTMTGYTECLGTGLGSDWRTSISCMLPFRRVYNPTLRALGASLAPASTRSAVT